MFRTAKKKWSALLSHRSGFAGARRALTRAEFVDEICSIWYECLSPSNIKNGFAATGIFPVNSVKYPRKRFNARLLRRYEVWRAEGKQQDMEIMATSAVTPQKIKPSTNTEVTTSNSGEDFLLSPVCTGVCSIIGPKPTSDPGKGKEWVPMWIPSVIHPNAKSTPSKESEEEPCSSASTSFENIILEKIRTVSASQPKKRRKIDIGAVVISDDTYLKKISDTKPKSKPKKKQLPMPWIDENEEEEREKALLLEDEEEDDEEQQDMSPQEKIVSYWRSISPPTEEKDIKQTWCACTYPNKKSKSILFLGRIQKRFLAEKLGPIDSVEILCTVKEQSGRPGVYETISNSYISATHQLQQDVDIYPAARLLCPAKMVPLKGGKWLCKNFASIQTLLSVSREEREKLYTEFVNNF